MEPSAITNTHNWTLPPAAETTLLPAVGKDGLPRPKLPADLKQWFLLPHRSAPHLSSQVGMAEALLTLKQLAAEVTSQTPQLNDFIRQMIYEASLVNLWFFLKFVLGAYGPYDELNEQIHLEIANARQFMTFDGCRGAICIFRKAFKDIATTTPILTANRGWITHGEVRVGDQVFSREGRPVTVKGLSERFRNNRCLKITFRHAESIICGEEHLWIARRPSSVEKVWEARDLRPGDVIPVNQAVQWPEADLPIDPYLLGVWLGDGHNSSPRITCADRDTATINRLRERGVEVRQGNGTRSGVGIYSIGGGSRGHKGSGIWPVFRRLNLPRNKHIPTAYLTASEAQRWDLLRGLMDTDGTTQRGNAIFINTHRPLIDDVYALATSLGLKPKLYQVDTHYEGKPYTYWRVSFRHFTDRQPFYLPRKAAAARPPTTKRERRAIVAIEEVPSVETSCIWVEGGNYLVGRDLLVTHNTTICTHGAITWEIIRNPDINIGLVCMKIERAEAFVDVVAHNFTSNPLLTEVMPQFVPPPAYKETWNRTKLISPARTRYFQEPTLTAMGAEGAQEGQHFDLIDLDDIAGTSELDAQHMSNVDMEKKRNWVKNAQKTLVKNQRTSRLVAKFTRYSEDDTYGDWFRNAYQFIGPEHDINDPPHVVSDEDTGRWVIYYSGWEDGKGGSRFPERVSVEAMEELKVDDWWTYATQYLNKPWAAGQAELIEAELHRGRVDWQAGYPIIAWERPEDPTSPRIFKEDTLPLSDLHVVMAVDPAGTDRGISAKTSRSVIQVWAQDHLQYKYLLEERAGFWSSTTLFDEMYGVWDVWGPWTSGCYLETNGAFKVLKPLLDRENILRDTYMPVIPSPSSGDKVANIRMVVGQPVGMKKIVLMYGQGNQFEKELRIFPSSHQMDALDCGRIALRNLRVPVKHPAPDYGDFAPEDVEEFSYDGAGVNETTGY